MKTLTKILLVVATALVVALGFTISCNRDLRKELEKEKHNSEVVKDSLYEITSAYGETIFANQSLILEKKELEEALALRKNEVKEYEKDLKAKIAYIATLESKLEKKDTVTIVVYQQDTSGIYKLHYDDSWLAFDQGIKVGEESLTSELYNVSMNLPLTVGLTDEYTIFVTSPNPYFKVTSLEGAVVDKGRFAPKQQRLYLGLYAGFGLQYGIINKQLDLGPQVGAGVIYVIF